MKYEVEKDHQLTVQLIQGDPAAFEQLFDRYNEKLYLFVNSYLHNPVEAEEIVQDVFYKVWKSKSRLKNGLAFKSYLFTIAINTIRDFFSRKQMEDKHRQEIAREFLLVNEEQQEQMDYHQALSIINDLLNRLPEKRKEIFLLSRKEGLTIGEIANYLDLSEATVKNQITAATKFLREEARKRGGALVLFVSLFIE